MIFSKTFLNSKISFISRSFKKNILSHLAKKLQARQYFQCAKKDDFGLILREKFGLYYA